VQRWIHILNFLPTSIQYSTRDDAFPGGTGPFPFHRAEARRFPQEVAEMAPAKRPKAGGLLKPLCVNEDYKTENAFFFLVAFFSRLQAA
jgi:hypothetical protein